MVLRDAGIEPHLAGLHVDLVPLQRQNLARRPPPRDVRERHDGLHVHRQVVLDALKLLRGRPPASAASFPILPSRYGGLVKTFAVCSDAACGLGR